MTDLSQPCKEYSPKSFSNTKIRTTMQTSLSYNVSFFLNGNEIISDLCWWCLEQVCAHLLTWFTRGVFFLWAKCCTPCKTKVMALTEAISLRPRYTYSILNANHWHYTWVTEIWIYSWVLSSVKIILQPPCWWLRNHPTPVVLLPFIQHSLHKYSIRVAYKYTCFCWKLLLKFTALHTTGIVWKLIIKHSFCSDSAKWAKFSDIISKMLCPNCFQLFLTQFCWV